MCGRYVLFTVAEQLLGAAANFSGQAISAPLGTPPARYNIAPTTPVPLLRRGRSAPPELELLPARWGLIPPWAREIPQTPLFNARQETLTHKPAFKDSYPHCRCLLPMNGYYEWTSSNPPATVPPHPAGAGKKVPYYLSLPATQGPLLFAAGLYSEALGQLSVTMLTCAAPERTAWLHPRSPVFLDAAGAQDWLEGAPAQFSAPPLMVQPANLAVGKVGQDYPQLLSP